MALDSIIRKVVKIADKVTVSVQGTVTHKAFVSDNGFGVPTFSPIGGTTRQCVIDQSVSKRMLPDGRLVAVKAALYFLEPVLPQGTAGRQEPIDPRDEIVLPDGGSGPIVHIEKGVIDPTTNRGFYVAAWLGA